MQINLLMAAMLAIGAWPGVSLAESDESEGGRELNTAGVFVGMTGADRRRDTGLTLALLYERHISESFGVGVEAERVVGDLEFWVATLPFAYHYKAWKFFAGPGLEMADDGEDELLLRVGLDYAFAAGRWEIVPSLAFDFVDSETEIIAGVGLVYGF